MAVWPASRHPSLGGFVKDAQGAPAYGRTNWRRFAIVAIAPVVAASGLMAGVASGAVPANFVVSGQSFKLSASRLEGDGFTQYSGQLKKQDGTQPVAKSGILHAEIYDLCQSVAVGPFVLRIEAGKNNKPAVAEDLLIGMSSLKGTAKFKNIDIGQDASTLDRDKTGAPHGAPGSFGQQAEHVTITDLQQVAYSTSASSFTLTGMSLALQLTDPEECF
jgi:hypothetical protein